MFFEIFWKYLEKLFYSSSVNSTFHLLKRLQDLNSTYVLSHGSIGNDFNNFKFDFPVQVQVFYYPILGSTAFLTWSCTKATWSWGHYAIFQIFLMWIGASETCSCQVCTAFCIRENTERNPVFSYISCSVGGKDFFLKPYDLTIMTLSVSFKLFQT